MFYYTLVLFLHENGEYYIKLSSVIFCWNSSLVDFLLSTEGIQNPCILSSVNITGLEAHRSKNISNQLFENTSVIFPMHDYVCKCCRRCQSQIKIIRNTNENNLHMLNRLLNFF